MISRWRIGAIVLVAGAAVSAALAWWLAAGEERLAVVGAPRGSDARCEKVLQKLPQKLMGEERRSTTNPGTAAWGDEGQVQLRCGLPPAPPSPNRCVRVSGTDWVLDKEQADRGIWRAVSYGTDPAVQVMFTGTDTSGSAWAEVSDALGPLKRTGHRCTGTGDVSLPSPSN